MPLSKIVARPSTDSVVVEAPQSGFPSADLVMAAAGLLPGQRFPVSAAPWAEFVRDFRPFPYTRPFSIARPIPGDLRKVPEGPSFFARVGPGVVELRNQDLAKSERTLNRKADARSMPPNDDPKAYIRAWSAKSRARMTLKLASVDYAPLIECKRPLALVTLTYPGDWLAVAPSGKVVKRHLQTLYKRWRRRWGAESACGVWKLEFQRRGAPHYHLLIALPAGCNGVVEFRAWLATAWASIVGATGEDFDRHLMAGVAVDTRGASRMRDVKRLAVYFTKHGLKASGDKEYQHIVPDAWEDGPGRFWGTWGLELSVATVMLSPADFIILRRLLRRHAKANGRNPKFMFGRGRLQGGFYLANDGPSFLSQLARALDQLTGC